MRMNSRRCRYCGSTLALRVRDDSYICPTCGAAYFFRDTGRAEFLTETDEPAALVLCEETIFGPSNFNPAVLDNVLKNTREQAVMNVMELAKEQVVLEERETENGYIVRAKLRVVGKDHVFR